MKARVRIGGIVVVLLVLTGGFLVWNSGKSRRESLAAVISFQESLASSERQSVLGLIILPRALRNRTETEQLSIIYKTLPREVTPEGLKRLRDSAEFGPLLTLFPEEGPRWAELSGVAAEECVAFRFGESPLAAEVALHQEKGRYRLIRINNVK